MGTPHPALPVVDISVSTNTRVGYIFVFLHGHSRATRPAFYVPELEVEGYMKAEKAHAGGHAFPTMMLDFLGSDHLRN